MSGDDKRLNGVTREKHWNGVTRAKNIALIDSPCVPCVFVPHLERYSPPPVQQHAIQGDEQMVEKRTKTGICCLASKHYCHKIRMYCL